MPVGAGLLVAVLAAVALVSWTGRSGPPGPAPAAPAGDFRPSFGRSGLVTNEYAHRHPGAGGRTSPDWVVTSGSLFARDGAGWTGPPDRGSPGLDSAEHTNSATFRLASRRRDFRDVVLTCRLRLATGPGARDPGGGRAYDGVHLWLRYQGPDELYAVTVARRDGQVVVKRKNPGSADAYTDLAARRVAVRPGDWHAVEASILDTARGPRIRLTVDGRLLLDVTDSAPTAVRRSGGVGLRGDATEFEFRDLVAREVPPPTATPDSPTR